MVGMPNPMASQAAWSALAHNKWCDKILAKVSQQYASNNQHISPIMHTSIVLHAFGYLSCFKLCQHNRPGPKGYLTAGNFVGNNVWLKWMDKDFGLMNE